MNLCTANVVGREDAGSTSDGPAPPLIVFLSCDLDDLADSERQISLFLTWKVVERFHTVRKSWKSARATTVTGSGVILLVQSGFLLLGSLERLSTGWDA